MRRSLQQRLSLVLCGALLLAALGAGVASFLLAYGEAKEFQDDMLRQISLLVASSGGKPTQSLIDSPLGDPESRLQVFRFPGAPLPSWFSAGLAGGFHTLNARDVRLRVFVYKNDRGYTSVVAQPTDARNEIALNSALRTLLPLVLLLPVMALLVVWIVRGELGPINTLAYHLDEQPADHAKAIPDRELPKELLPFIQAINRLLMRVNELVGQQRRFIADAAHELRSPLTALSVQTQNLEQAKSIEAMRARVAPLRSGIERARKLTEQLLNLAHTQSGRGAADPVNVSELIRELIAEFLPSAEQRQVDLGMEELSHLSLHASPDALRLVIRNGLENALKYSPAGSEVTVRLFRDDRDAVIDVIDQGPGIPQSERTRVFDPFYQNDGVGGSGSGLGLAIAKAAAASLQGSITLLTPSSGKGLIFRYRQVVDRLF